MGLSEHRLAQRAPRERQILSALLLRHFFKNRCGISSFWEHARAIYNLAASSTATQITQFIISREGKAAAEARGGFSWVRPGHYLLKQRLQEAYPVQVQVF